MADCCVLIPSACTCGCTGENCTCSTSCSKCQNCKAIGCKATCACGGCEGSECRCQKDCAKCANKCMVPACKAYSGPCRCVDAKKCTGCGENCTCMKCPK